MQTDNEKKTDRTRRKIMDTYLCLLKQKSFNKISVRDIVENAHIARSTFYAYFEDVYDLVDEIEKDLLAGFVVTCDKSQFQQGNVNDLTMINNVQQWLDYGMSRRESFLAIMGHYGDPYFQQRMQKRLKTSFISFIELDGYPDDESRAYFVAFLTHAFIGVFLRWIKVGEHGTITSRKLAGVVANLRYVAITQNNNYLL